MVGKLDLLRGLYEKITIPTAVFTEIRPGLQLPDWIAVAKLAQPIPTLLCEAELGVGETEAIALAMQTPGSVLLLDDRRARKLAMRLGVAVSGTLSVLLRAKEQGLIGEVQPTLDLLVREGLRVSQKQFDSTLFTAGESRR